MVQSFSWCRTTLLCVEENVKKSNFSLKRSVSSIGFGNSIQHNTNLRGTKSFTGIMALRISSQETKGTQMNDDNNANNNAGYCGEQEPSEDKVIETVDLITNEVISFKENILSYQGRTYLLGDISYKWKKDCRMWLWKNRPSMKQEIGDLRNNQSINITTLA